MPHVGASQIPERPCPQVVLAEVIEEAEVRLAELLRLEKVAKTAHLELPIASSILE